MLLVFKLHGTDAAYAYQCCLSEVCVLVCLRVGHTSEQCTMPQLIKMPRPNSCGPRNHVYGGTQWASWKMWLNDRCTTAVWPYRHCSHRICSRVYETVRRLSFCPSVPSCTVAVACHRFAAVGSLGRQYRSFTARRICSRSSRLSIHIHSSTLVSNKCEQCHVYSDVAS